MSESEKDPHGEPASPADRTLLGVAPPRLDGAENSPRNPVFVRAGDSVADVAPPPLPRMALPSRPPRPSDSAAEARFATDNPALRLAREYPVLWMVAAPALLALCVIGLAVATAPAPREEAVATATPPVAPAPAIAEQAKPASQTASLPSLAELEAKPLGTLSASELILVAQGRAERERLAARALRDKVSQSPALLSDKALQTQLLQAARDTQTAPEALAALASASSPLGADLLYEVWTGRPSRTESTELARALLYSPQVRPHASPALSVALALRAAETCEQHKAALPDALKDGDKRSLNLLAKLVNRRGCGPKKAQDCFACLRAEPDELSATINAVKSRRAPLYPTP